VNLTEAAKVAEIIVVIASISGVGILWSTIKTLKESNSSLKENNEALKDRVSIVEEETKLCNAQHHENIKLIKKLEGKIETYSELVLIPEKFMQEIQDNQKEIIKLLKK